jgi:hypothetical protein
VKPLRISVCFGKLPDRCARDDFYRPSYLPAFGCPSSFNLPMEPALSVLAQALITERLLLRPANRQYAPALLGYYVANRAHLMPWEPLRLDLFCTLRSIEMRLESQSGGSLILFG